MNRDVAIDALAIATLFALACVIARSAGFDHVSDDDFARVTIAQSFARSPKWDPSGTSWLPFPFWLMGGTMILVGRSLTAARALAILFASAATALPYVALRAARMDRVSALATVVFAMATPWAIWSGAATVPESVAASLMTAGAVGLLVPTKDGAEDTAAHPKRSALFALCLFAACLSRYEVWPVAFVVATALIVRERSRTNLLLAIVVAAGPLLWMAWNAHAHDGPLHFFRRVSTFKRALGEPPVSTLDALMLYPRLLVTTRPEATLAAAAVFFVRVKTRAWRRSGWAFVLLAALAQVLFLAIGNARDGAPAHHPERALLGTFYLLAIFTSQSVLALASSNRRLTFAVLGCVGLTLALALTRALSPTRIPGHSESEDRRRQVARGESLRSEPHLSVTPCQFEHFALIAAYGRPESVTVRPSTKAPIAPDCPEVTSPSSPSSPSSP